VSCKDGLGKKLMFTSWGQLGSDFFQEIMQLQTGQRIRYYIFFAFEIGSFKN